MSKLKIQNPYLTARMVTLIKKINDSEDKELICATPGGWWVDHQRVFASDAYALLSLVLIRQMSYDKDIQRYELTPCAFEMLEDPNRKPDYIIALQKRREEEKIIIL